MLLTVFILEAIACFMLYSYTLKPIFPIICIDIDKADFYLGIS